MQASFKELREKAAAYHQEHLFRFWEMLTDGARNTLLAQAASIDFPLMARLIHEWVEQEPPAERFARIEPVPMIPKAAVAFEEHGAALAAGEDALRKGQAGIFLVAGGQGTRLGFDGPKGAYPIGPVTGKSIFAYHAEKILNLQRRYGCVLPWYIMVSEANAAPTRLFFEENAWFGLDEANVCFHQQRMVPCVDEEGHFFLEAPHRIAMNPNGHGGAIPAMVENGILEDARSRGIRYLTFFQVDNWAVKVADPLFLGYHILRGAEMSSKNHAKDKPREAVGVHCLCDGEYRVIEYSELDIYPQLLETDAEGRLKHRAGNPAIHIFSVDFVQRLYDHFDTFPWHRAHKKIPHIDAKGYMVAPEAPNGYKFETFIFDALRLIQHAPVALEIDRQGEYTPIKQFEGDNSVVAARQRMADYWAGWLDAAGMCPPRDGEGHCTVPIEISPLFALTQEEFLSKVGGLHIDPTGPIVIDAG